MNVSKLHHSEGVFVPCIVPIRPKPTSFSLDSALYVVDLPQPGELFSFAVGRSRQLHTAVTSHVAAAAAANDAVDDVPPTAHGSSGSECCRNAGSQTAGGGNLPSNPLLRPIFNTSGFK
jgi:hypothetical protein